MDDQKQLLDESRKSQHASESDKSDNDEPTVDHQTKPLMHDNTALSESAGITLTESKRDGSSVGERGVAASVADDRSSSDLESGVESLELESSGNDAELAADSSKCDDSRKDDVVLAEESVKRDSPGNDAESTAESVEHEQLANVETGMESASAEGVVDSEGPNAKDDSAMRDMSSKKAELASMERQAKVEAALRYTDVFIADVSDAARYSYMSMCAVLLHRLFGDDSSDTDFKTNFIACLGKHLQVPEQVLLSSQALQRGLGMDNPDPFAKVILQEAVIKEHSAAILLNDLVTIAIQEGCYDSRARVLLRAVGRCMGVEWDIVESLEDNAVHCFEEEEHHLTEEEKAEQIQKEKNKKRKRYVMIGLATVGGGALLGLTGGLAAPFLAAGAGAVIGTAGATALGSTAGVAIMASLFGAAGAGLGGFKMNKRVGEIDEFTFEPLTEGNQLHVTIAISGWLSEDQEFKHTWLGLANSKEQYVLKYESKYLRELGKSLDYVLSFALGTAAQELLKYTVLSSLMVAITWPVAVLSVAAVIDNPWGVCTQRAMAAGRILADVLHTRQQGKRPVTLIGFSLGARVIFYCLEELSKRKNCMGIIEDAILLGAPVTGNSEQWAKFGRIVAGRLVNGYCKGDWLLRYVYRTTSIQVNIAGLYPIEWDDRRMHNVDLGSIVTGHMDYMKNMDAILEAVGVRTKEYSMGARENSLRQWVQIQRGQRPGTARLKSSESSDHVKVADKMKDVRITRTASSVPDALGSRGDDDGATE